MIILYFFIGLVLSFLGSIPIGLITLTITQRTLEKGRTSGLMIALGATIMEFVYTFVALISLDIFSKNDMIGQYIKMFATVVFLGMGLYYFFKKNTSDLKTTPTYDYFDFLRGIAVGAMNLLIVPFWIFLGLWLESNGYIFDNYSIITVFSIGSAIGALLMFLIYIWMSESIINKSKQIKKYTNKAVGVLFLGLGIFQLIQLL